MLIFQLVPHIETVVLFSLEELLSLVTSFIISFLLSFDLGFVPILEPSFNLSDVISVGIQTVILWISYGHPVRNKRARYLFEFPFHNHPRCDLNIQDRYQS